MVNNRRMFRNARRMANGGMAMPTAQGTGIASGMAPTPPPMDSGGQADPLSVVIPQEQQLAAASQLADGFNKAVDQAENAEDLMDTVRGKPASMDQRRAELAALVGEEDANKTPESVLILLQPLLAQMEQQDSMPMMGA